MFSPRRAGPSAAENRPAAMSSRIRRPASISSCLRGRDRQRNADRVADAKRNKLLEGPTGLVDPFRRHSRLRHAQMERHVGPLLGKQPIDLDHGRRIRVLQRNAKTRKPQPVQQLAMIQGALQHRPKDVVPGEPLPLGRIDRAAIHAHAQGAIVPAGHVDQEPHLVLPRPVTLVMVKMAGVVADFVHPGGNVRGQPVVLLKIDREVRPAAAADFGQGLRILGRVGGNPHHARPSGGQMVHLGNRRLDVGRLRGAHALHHDRPAVADRDRADADRSGLVATGASRRHVFEHETIFPLADGQFKPRRSGTPCLTCPGRCQPAVRHRVPDLRSTFCLAR